MTEPTPWDYAYGYTLAVILGAGFWAWVGVETAVGLAKKAIR